MIFYRILNNQIHPVYETDKLGFPSDDSSYISDEYLENREFVVMRTCHGVGDWGILSAMPYKVIYFTTIIESMMMKIQKYLL